MSEAQRRAYAIADNKIALNAGWDEGLLATELVDLEALGFDLDLTGFAVDEIEALVASQAANEGLTDPDEVSESRRRRQCRLLATCGPWGGIGCCAATPRWRRTWRGCWAGLSCT